MVYIQEVIAAKETVLEYRYLIVNTGAPVPTPATGYQVQIVFTDLVGKDLYIEYKTFEQGHVCS